METCPSTHGLRKLDWGAVHLLGDTILWRWVRCHLVDFYALLMAPCFQVLVDKLLALVNTDGVRLLPAVLEVS
jgi:hypothetical protein